MTQPELEEYKKSAKVGDRVKSINYGDTRRVVEVVDRGVVTVCHIPGTHWDGTHRSMDEWTWLAKHFNVIHKEA